jgi:hypothetical protein
MANSKSLPSVTLSPLDTVTNLSGTACMGMSLGVGIDDLDCEDVTLAAFVIDMSSSMSSVRQAVIDSYNKEIHALKSAKTASSILISTTTFSNQPQLLHSYQKIQDVPALTSKTYQPQGCTALYDAVLGVFGDLTSYRTNLSDNGVRSTAMVIVLSDGDDNSSRAKARQVAQESRKLLQEEGIILAYAGFGAKKNLQTIAQGIGFPSVLTTSQNAQQIRKVLGQVSASILRTSQGGVAGPATSFFI